MSCRMFNGRLAADHLLDRIKLVSKFSLTPLFWFPVGNYVKPSTIRYASLKPAPNPRRISVIERGGHF